MGTATSTASVDLDMLRVPDLDSMVHQREENVYHAGDAGFEAVFDRVLIIEDPFVSGYECKACNKTGRLLCDNCRGSGISTLNANIRCTQCQGTKMMACPDCRGLGETLIVPDVSKRRPTTGTIMSVGCDVKEWNKGDTVLYSNFCGEAFDVHGVGKNGEEREVPVRIVREREIICRVTGHLEMRRMSKVDHQISG